MSQKLTTTTRTRYANATMTNADDRTAQSQQSVRTAAFSQWGYPNPNIWGNPSGTVLANTENLGSRGSSKETPPSHPLAPTSETEAWKTSWGPGAEASRTRNTSGSTSPNRTRDTVGRTLSSTSPYTTTAEPHAQPAIGQRAPANGTSHWNTGTPFETSPRSQGQLQPGFLDGNSEETPGVAFEPDSSARGFRNETRAFQETYNRVGASTFPRDNSSSLGSLPNADTQSQGRHYSDTGYDSRAPSAGHPQRDSISGSLSFGNTAMNVRIGNNPGDDLDNFDNRFGAMSLNDGSVATPSAAGGFPKYNNNNNPAGRPFQFNPDSQSWENLGSQGTGNDSRFQTIQGGASDRGFLVNGAYHQSRGSPRISGPTPQPIRDSMYGLASRDPRSMAEANHRGRGQQLPGQHLAQLYPQQYYDPGFGAPPQLFGPGYNPAMNLRFPQAYPTQYMPTNYSTLSNRPSRDHDSADAQRSPLLRDFRIANKTNKRFELRDIYGHVVEFCGDQHGSRFIQDKLNTANSDEKDQIFKEIEPDAIPLMMDVFGNYVVQKLFEHGSQIHKTLLQKAMRPRMVNLSLDQYGCRVVQKALQHVLSHEQHELVKELEPEVLKVMKDTNGNHVIQKALERIDDKRYLAFIFSSFRGKVKELACHTCACRVLQKAIDVGPESDKASIIKEVHAHTRELTNDQYGNYVVQHILKECKAEDRTPIINSVLGDVVHLSKQKYASNVIEKCVQFGTPEEVLKIATEMTTPGPDGTVPLRMMIIDQFANYVIQKYLEKENFNKQAFVEALRPELQWARNSNYSGKNVERIAELLSKMSPVQGGQATPSTRLSSTAPTSPLQLDVGSAAPTPNLTMGPNSPSSSPPSTTESAVDEPDEVAVKAQIASADELIRGPEVRVQE